MSAVIVGTFEGFRKNMAPRSLANRFGIGEQKVTFSFPMAYVITQGSTVADTGWLYVGFRVPTSHEEGRAMLATASWQTLGEEIRDRTRRIEAAVAAGVAPSVAGEELLKNGVGAFEKASDFRRLAVKQFGTSTEFECVNNSGYPAVRIGIRDPGDLDRVSTLFTKILHERFVGR
jgi:hypothetical protein